MADKLTGACLCGACTFTAEPSPEAGVCHCSMCRRFSGGMFIVTDCSGSLAFDEGAPVTAYASSPWGRRLFCSKCGSSLAWQAADGGMTFVSVQAFPDPGRFPVTGQLFIDCKPGSYDLANETHNVTEAEFLAMYGPAPEGNA